MATLCCLVHALLPFLFEKTSSRIISGLHERMVTHRVKSKAVTPDSRGAARR